MEEFIQLNKQNIDNEHICCAFSDKKCADSYQKKKEWLKNEFETGYVFRRIDARAKVFIEYGPAEEAWLPIHADHYLNINCLWVSGKYKKQGYAKVLLQSAIEDAKQQGKAGLMTVVGTKKFHFMSDTKWLLKQGFKEVDKLDYGFSLLAMSWDNKVQPPSFPAHTRSAEIDYKEDVVAYYSNRCPFAEYHVSESLKEATDKRKLSLKTIKLNSKTEARLAPSPATIFSLYYKGKFVTTDISVCMDSRMDKILDKV